VLVSNPEKWRMIAIRGFFMAVLIEPHIQWAGQKWMGPAHYM
jgi:hypothetical protein